MIGIVVRVASTVRRPARSATERKLQVGAGERVQELDVLPDRHRMTCDREVRYPRLASRQAPALAITALDERPAEHAAEALAHLGIAVQPNVFAPIAVPRDEHGIAGWLVSGTLEGHEITAAVDRQPFDRRRADAAPLVGL
jgi:hypothetical protein